MKNQAPSLQKNPSIEDKILSNYESRAALDGRVLFLVLARADINYQMEELINQNKWQELTEFIVTSLVQMIEKSEPGQDHWNKAPILESELKPVDIMELIQEKEETLTQLTSKITLPLSYFPPADPKERVGEYLPKILKQQASEEDSAHADRVKNHLTIVTDTQFANIGHLVDPDDPAQVRFLNLYTEL